MGNEQSAAQTQLNSDRIMNLINTSAQQSQHAEKSASALETLALVAVIIVIAVGLYLVYRLITKFERMRGQAQLDSVIALGGLKANVAGVRN